MAWKQAAGAKSYKAIKQCVLTLETLGMLVLVRIILNQSLCFLLSDLRPEQGTILEDSYFDQVSNAGEIPTV